MDRKRILLVGAGRWGKIYLRNLESHPRARVAGLVTSQARSALPHLEPSCEIFGSLPEALRAGAWDGVILATPPETHSDQLRFCLAGQIPVIVEKPLTLSLPEARALVNETAAGSVLVDHIFLFHPGYERLKAMLAPRGRIRAIHSEGGNQGPYRTYSPLWDYGAHDLSMILDLTGEAPATVKARVENAGLREGGLAGDYSASLTFPSGATATFRASNLAGYKVRRISVETEHDRFLLEDFPAPRLTRTALSGGVPEEIALPPLSPLANLLSVFLDGIEGRKDSRWGLSLGVAVVETLSTCEQALAQA